MSASQACDSISEGGWELAGHVGIENEVANMSQEQLFMATPATFKDIATGELIPNDRCLYVCQELDRIHKVFQEGRKIYKNVMRDTAGSIEERRAAARHASEAHAGGG